MKPLPSIRRRGFSAEIEPRLVIDTREQDPLPIARFPVVRAALQTGDYSFAGGEDRFAVERKTVEDLVGCCAGDNRARFKRELHRLRGFEFARLLVIGSREAVQAGRYRSRIRPDAVLGSLAAWEVRYRVPVVFAPDAHAAARLVEAWVWWFVRENILCFNQLIKGSAPAAP